MPHLSPSAIERISVNGTLLTPQRHERSYATDILEASQMRILGQRGPFRLNIELARPTCDDARIRRSFRRSGGATLEFDCGNMRTSVPLPFEDFRPELSDMTKNRRQLSRMLNAPIRDIDTLNDLQDYLRDDVIGPKMHGYLSQYGIEVDPSTAASLFGLVVESRERLNQPGR